MSSFDLDHFTRRLLAESLFYDEEYGALGDVSLVDQDAAQERFLAAYLPAEGTFMVEEATEWEEYTPDADDDIGYALAVNSDEHGTYETPDEAAAVLLSLAREHDLTPSITILFEEDEVA